MLVTDRKKKKTESGWDLRTPVKKIVCCQSPVSHLLHLWIDEGDHTRDPYSLITTVSQHHCVLTQYQFHFQNKMKTVFVSQAIDSAGPEEYLISEIHERFSESQYLTFLSSEPVSRVVSVIMTQKMIGYTNLVFRQWTATINQTISLTQALQNVLFQSEAKFCVLWK